MATTRRETLEWSETAPIRVQGTAATTASPEAVFAVLADHARWPEWFPKVKAVEILGPAEGVGARRRVKIPGLAVDEEFIAWEPGKLFAFTATAAKPGAFKALVEHCRIKPSERGGCDVTWTMTFEPHPLAAPVMKLARRSLEANLGTAMANLARRAEASEIAQP
jgi:ribosome-associated toxin RatA of RatAB toxin-antitoxin module